MTTINHTPGPWTIAWGAYADWIESDSADGRTIAWTCNSLDNNGEECISQEDIANARLIASAPELLQALENLYERAVIWVASIENVDFSSHAGVYDQIPWAQAEAAIAKAKGVTDECCHWMDRQCYC
jgi:hypothetical protein